MTSPAVPSEPSVRPPAVEFDSESGLLPGVRWLPSPNFDDRPLGVVPDLVVIHAISLPPGQFGGQWIDAFFTNTLDPNVHPYFQRIRGLRTSAHLLISREGELTQYVALHHRAWHAGYSSYGGRRNCNDYSIGIELEGSNQIAYTDIQYRCLTAVIRALMRTYPAISEARIVGHADVAPGRKTDPGSAFDWRRLRQELAR
jgi:AmpD protein